jgi:hypothetical protein
MIGRRLSAILAAIGLISLIGNLIDLPMLVKEWVEAWRTVTRPIWEFVFGWLFQYFHIKMPIWLKDYFTMGVIAAGMEVRSTIYDRSFMLKTGYHESEINTRTPIPRVFVASSRNQTTKFYLVALPILAVDDFIRWPIRVFTVTLRAIGLIKQRWGDEIWWQHKKKADLVYFEAAIYAALFLGAAFSFNLWR